MEKHLKNRPTTKYIGNRQILRNRYCMKITFSKMHLFQNQIFSSYSENAHNKLTKVPT